MTQGPAPQPPSDSATALPPAAKRLREGRLLLARAAKENGRADLDRYPAASSAAMDTYFRERLEEIAEASPGLLAAPLALIAVGGYGRGELQPASDVDVLLLYAQDIPKAAEEISRGLFHPLWDLGLDLGHGVRTAADCLRLAREDTQVLTSLLDTRLVAGDEAIVGRFLRDFSVKVLSGGAQAFGQWVLEHNVGRRSEYGDSSGLLEPDLKNGLGALRDVHQIHWLTQVLAANPQNPRLPFTRGDLEALEQDRRFLMAARTALHLAAGRKTDKLGFDRQPEVALALGFDGADVSVDAPDAEWAAAMARGLAVERFLSSLHQAMARIRAMRQAAWVEAFPPPGPPPQPASPGSGAGQVLATPTGLTLANALGDEALPSPAELLALYLEAARAARPVAWSGLRATRRALAGLPPESFAGLPGLLPALLEIFRASGRETDMAPLGVTPPQKPGGGLTRALKSFFAPAKAPVSSSEKAKPAPDARECVPSVAGALQSMLDTGLLTALVPEFGPVEHLVQFDDFHIHPVGKHTLEVVRTLAAMLGETAQAGPGSWQGRTARELDGQGLFDRLLLAGFCHDLAKPSRDHSGDGAGLCEGLLARLGADEATVADVSFLVRQHLVIPKTATRRDLADEAVSAGLAELCGSVQRLDMLLLLAVADSQATGPRAWNPWTATLFTELSGKARRLLTAGPLAEPHAVEHGRRVREEVLALAAAPGSQVGAQRAQELLERMPSRAPLVLDAPTLLRHMELVRRFEAALEEDLIRKPSGKGGVGVTEIDAVALAHGRFQVSIAAPDQPGLFAVLAGVLALHDLNILSAEVLTWKRPPGWSGGPIAVDVFVVQEPGEGLYLEDLWQRIRRAISYALTGKLSLDYRLEQKRSSPLSLAPGAPKGRRKVRVDSESSDFYTLIEVAAPDRLGLLYDLASAISGLGLVLHLARIATSAGRIHDTFYVRDEGGLKITDPDRAEEIRKALLAAAK